HIGREPTMGLAFALEALAIIALIQTAGNPVLFVVFSGFTYFGWGEIYSLFPATAGDLFGRQFATTNYGLLYTAKGTASLLVPLGNVLQEMTGSWIPIFGLSVAFDLAAALLAVTLLRSLHHAHVSRSAEQVEALPAAA